MSTLVFWMDVDNTLLNNDHVKEVWDKALKVELGPDLTRRFWDIYEQARHERGVIDIPLSLARLREQIPFSVMDEQTYEHVSSLFENYPFDQALYPHALETLRYLSTLGTTVVVSDGDKVFQAEKIVNSYIAEAVDGRVLLYTHKQEHLDEIMQRYPGDHYVIIDDKPQILADTRSKLGDLVTTVFVQQGHYAAEPLPDGFTPDISVARIGDLRGYNSQQFLTPAHR
jgi:FMN phosphatase YigB (HAD superfamily)